MPLHYRKRQFSFAELLIVVAIAAALMAWLRLRESWRYEYENIMLDARRIDALDGLRYQLFYREINTYIDERGRDVHPPRVPRATAWYGLVTVLTVAIGILLTTGHRHQSLRFLATMAISMVAAVLVFETGLLVIDLVIYISGPVQQAR